MLERSLSLASCLICLACTPDELDEPPEVPDVEYCDDVRDWDSEWSVFEERVVELLNEQRAMGADCTIEVFDPVGPLSMDPALRCAARKHALDMAEQDYFSNLDPDMVDFFMRAELAEYEGMPIDQNIGAAHSTPEQLVTAVMGSTELCVHVMSPDADQVGVGYLEFEGATYPNYWTQVFGSGS